MKSNIMRVWIIFIAGVICYAVADEKDITELEKIKSLAEEIIQELEKDPPYISTTTYAFVGFSKDLVQKVKNRAVQRYLITNFSAINRKVQPHIILLLGWFGYREVIPFMIAQSQDRRYSRWCYSALFTLTNNDSYMFLRKAPLTEEYIANAHKKSMEWWKENEPYLYKTIGVTYFKLNEIAKKNLTPVDEFSGEVLEKNK